MNTFVANPHWGWWITWYFYLGGIAAGAYFVASLADLVGQERDRSIALAGYFIAAPLVAICGVLLILDLTVPSRFWHMLFDTQSWRPHLKVWSPMSIGDWALLVFGLISSISFAQSLVELSSNRWRNSTRLQLINRRRIAGRVLNLVGSTCGFFIASYTGVLLTATNQPIWSNSPWIGALFLASAAATGLAAIKLVVQRLQPRSLPDGNCRLEHLEPWIWGLELITAGLFLGSLGRVTLHTIAISGRSGIFFVAALLLGIVVPFVLRYTLRRARRVSPIFAAVAVLLGGFMLRYSVLTVPSSYLHPVEIGSQQPTDER